MREDQSQPTLPEFYASLRATGLVRRLLELARDEDLGVGPGSGDITSMVSIPEGRRSRAQIVARRGGVVSGLEAMPELLDVFGSSVRLDAAVRDGQEVSKGEVIATLSGEERGLLTIERTALNLVGRLSGIATRTAEFVARVRGTHAHVYDTRKTTPGLRVLEKYAVRCGGGRSHRLGLHDAVLIKDNHIAGLPPERLAGVVREAAANARALRPDLLFIELEVDSLAQLRAALALEPGVLDIILLDNMDVPTMREAVRMRNESRSRPELEASGGVSLETITAIAGTGVERISVGALTHSATVLDVALDAVPEGA